MLKLFRKLFKKEKQLELISDCYEIYEKHGIHFNRDEKPRGSVSSTQTYENLKNIIPEVFPTNRSSHIYNDEYYDENNSDENETISILDEDDGRTPREQMDLDRYFDLDSYFDTDKFSDLDEYHIL